MKATFNGALQLSVLDGWWAEAYDGSNGWAIPGDEDERPDVVDARDAALFYDLLEHEVDPALLRPRRSRRAARLVRADQAGARHVRADVHARRGWSTTTSSAMYHG